MRARSPNHRVRHEPGRPVVQRLWITAATTLRHPHREVDGCDSGPLLGPRRQQADVRQRVWQLLLCSSAHIPATQDPQGLGVDHVQAFYHATENDLLLPMRIRHSDVITAIPIAVVMFNVVQSYSHTQR